MEGYDFFGNGESDSTEPETTEETNFNVKKWSLGDHQEDVSTAWSNIERSINNIESAAPGLADALAEAKDTVQSFSVSGFECSVCGLNHSHSDSKHDIRSAFSVTDEFAEGMKFSPFCHCGVSELARLVMYFSEIEGVVMFDDQHKFESVLELPSSTVRNIYRAMQEVTLEEADDVGAEVGFVNHENADQVLNFDQAVEYEAALRNGRTLTEDYHAELNIFYDRVDSIRSAASSAPIPSETEESLNENLGEL